VLEEEVDVEVTDDVEVEVVLSEVEVVLGEFVGMVELEEEVEVRKVLPSNERLGCPAAFAWVEASADSSAMANNDINASPYAKFKEREIPMPTPVTRS
jgi:hypothetical protein